jgi:hypothetical protein
MPDFSKIWKTLLSYATQVEIGSGHRYQWKPVCLRLSGLNTCKVGVGGRSGRTASASGALDNNTNNDTRATPAEYRLASSPKT